MREAERDWIDRRYYVLEYHGPVKVKDLKDLATDYERSSILDIFGPDTEGHDPEDTRIGTIWICQGHVLRFEVSAFQSEALPYSVFNLDPADIGIFGYGIPDMLHDQQSAFNAAWRLIMRNAGMSGLPMFVINEDEIEPADGNNNIYPGKVWIRTAVSDRPAIETVDIDANSREYAQIITLAKQFMEDESNLPLIAQGDQSGQTSRRRTA